LIYFVTEPAGEGSYLHTFQRVVMGEFARLGIPFCHVPLRGPVVDEVNYRTIASVSATERDVWFFAYAHNPAVRFVALRPGRRYGHAHGLAALAYEPAVLAGFDLDERRTLSHYHGVFLNSEWALGAARTAYPDLAPRLHVTGFPLDIDALRAYRSARRRPGLVVFNQRFSLEKLHILEVAMSEWLLGAGYEVWHLLPEEEEARVLADREAGALYRAGKRMGMRFQVTRTKGEYYHLLAQASVVVTTSLADTLSVGTVEAIAMGVCPVAPRWGPFPEYVHADNLYRPFNLREALALVAAAPEREHEVDRFSGPAVVGRYLNLMGW